jgi:hypothetical protein
MRLKSRRVAYLLVSTAAVLATLSACGPPSNLPHVTMVGDSTLAGMVWYDQAGVTRSQDVVRAAYDLTLDAESCRRLVAPSCRGRFGYVPNTTMDVLRANRGRLGEAVVIMGGYDDISIGDAVPQILAETEAQGVEHVIWLTYPLNVPTCCRAASRPAACTPTTTWCCTSTRSTTRRCTWPTGTPTAPATASGSGPTAST